MIRLEMVIVEVFHVIAMDRHVVVAIMEIVIPNDQVRIIDNSSLLYLICLFFFFLDACFKCTSF
jgi:hypothetical protein